MVEKPAAVFGRNRCKPLLSRFRPNAFLMLVRCRCAPSSGGDAANGAAPCRQHSVRRGRVLHPAQPGAHQVSALRSLVGLAWRSGLTHAGISPRCCRDVVRIWKTNPEEAALKVCPLVLFSGQRMPPGAEPACLLFAFMQGRPYEDSPELSLESLVAGFLLQQAGQKQSSAWSEYFAIMKPTVRCPPFRLSLSFVCAGGALLPDWLFGFARSHAIWRQVRGPGAAQQ